MPAAMAAVLERVFWIYFEACLRGDRPPGSAMAAAVVASAAATKSLRPRAFRLPDRSWRTVCATQEEEEEEQGVESTTTLESAKPRKAWRRQRCS